MIEIKNLYKRFTKDYLFEGFNLEIKDNAITSIIGPSGCGKTTLLRMVAGLEAYEQGTITGIDREKIAMVFQEDRLLPWLSVFQNIEIVLKSKMNKEEAQKRINTVLSMLDMQDTAAMMPSELSGGMQRRVAIGRAIAYDGEVLFLDEPFKGMDDKLKEEVLEELGQSWKKDKKTVILVTHDLSDAHKLSDAIYELSGRPIRQVRVTG